MIKGMYTHFSIGQTGRNDFDNDDVLEYEDKERYQDFENFYWDVLPEFKKFGKVVQFKVCSNHEPHLRGNVYVQFYKEEYAVEAYKSFNGRFYAGKQITCEFTNVIKWRSAICGLYFRKMCPKGNNCNFLHVFKNPSDEFRRADRDFSEFESAHSSHSSRSNRSRRNTDPRSSHYDYSNGSRRRHRGDYSPEHQSYRYSSRRHDRASDSESDGQESVRSSSSRKRHSGKDIDSSYRSHKRKHRDSRSRSRSPHYLSDEPSVNNHKKHKHKKKKKSKKSKKERDSEESGDS